MTRTRGPGTAADRTAARAPAASRLLAYAEPMAKAKSKSTRPAKTAARNIGNNSGQDLDKVAPRARPAAATSAKDAAARAVAKPASPKTERPEKPAAKAADDKGEKSEKASTARKVPAPTKRTTPSASSRYTPPVPKSEKVSPMWVPVLMFACLGLGMLIIILNYVNVLPGANPSNVYLFAGLILITIGFITATKFH